MFEKKFIANAINRSAENQLDRRRFLKAAGLTGVGVGARAPAESYFSRSAGV